MACLPAVVKTDPLGAARGGTARDGVARPHTRAPAAVRTPFLDIVVHGGSLARATGQDTTIPPDLAAEALDISQDLLSPELRELGVFGPEIPASAEDPLHDRLVAFMGRRP